jgi:hypothetical protein
MSSAAICAGGTPANLDSEGWRLKVPLPDRIGVFEPQQVEWVMRRLTPHPLKSFSDPLVLERPLENGFPKTYVAATNPSLSALAGARSWVREQPDWRYSEIATGHGAMVIAPYVVAALLQDLA